MNLTQKFLLDRLQNEKLAVAADKNQAVAAQPQKIFSDDLGKIFPEGNEIVKSNKIPNINEKDELKVTVAKKICYC